MNPSEENLIGYVLGALDAQEQRDLQTQIDSDPDLEDRLLEIKNSLRPLDYIDTSGYRPGLARRTCEMVASHTFDQTDRSDWSNRSETTNSAAPYLETIGEVQPANQVSRQLWHPTTWSVPDIAVAAACVAILAGILFPAVSYTRYHSRIADCQHNLHNVGNALLRYSDIHGGRFVEIPDHGPLAASGTFAPILKQAGLIEDDGWFFCAGAAAERPRTQPLRIPTVAMLEQATGEQLMRMQRNMSGNFGYTLGHVSNRNEYVAPRNLGRTNVVLLADAPSLHLPGRRSNNHGGHGQNLFFEDGHVEFIKGDSYGEDAIFVNDYNIVAPGTRPDDNVIAPSHLAPRIVP